MAQYIPPSKERQQLEALLKTDGMVELETASVTLKNLSEHKLEGLVDLSSKQLNLQLNLPIDINVDGSLNELLKSWEGFAIK